MATYPPVGDLERDDAIARIRRRHELVDDSRWSEAGADSDDPARAVLGYLRRHRGRFPRQVVQDDVWDELVLAAWVYWDERRREHELFSHALARGLSLREVGAYVGLHSGQGLRDHLDSIEARLVEHRRLTRSPVGDRVDRGDIDGTRSASGASGAGAVEMTAPSTSSTRDAGSDGEARRSRNPYLRFQGRSRASRGADGKFVRSQRATARQRPSREQWVRDHHTRIASVLAGLVTQADRVLHHAADTDPGADPVAATLDPREYVDWVREDLEDDDVSDATIVSAGLAASGMRLLPTVTALPRHHALHGALRETDRLRADYGALRPGP